MVFSFYYVVAERSFTEVAGKDLQGLRSVSCKPDRMYKLRALMAVPSRVASSVSFVA